MGKSDVEDKTAESLELEDLELSASTAGRVIRPSDGVLLDDRHFKLEDVGQLARALIEHSEGRLDQLRSAAEEVESRIRAKAEESRQRIERALDMSRKLVDERQRESKEKAEILEKESREKGYEEGRAEGRDEGYRAGFEEGLEKGLAEGRTKGEAEIRDQLAEKMAADVDGLAGMAQSLVEELESRTGELLRDARDDLVRLSISIAERIIRREIREVPDVIQGVVAAGVEKVADRRQLTIEVHPADRAATEAYLEELSRVLGETSVLQLTECEELSRGGCRVRSGATTVDLSIETQLEILERRLVQSNEGAE